MPPKKREYADSSADSQNELKVRALKSTSRLASRGRPTCDTSVNLKLSPYRLANTMAFAADCVACPDVKPGNGGAGQNIRF